VALLRVEKRLEVDPDANSGADSVDGRSLSPRGAQTIHHRVFHALLSEVGVETSQGTAADGRGDCHRQGAFGSQVVLPSHGEDPLIEIVSIGDDKTGQIQEHAACYS